MLILIKLLQLATMDSKNNIANSANLSTSVKPTVHKIGYIVFRAVLNYPLASLTLNYIHF